jgi:hypothetical protein
LDVTGKREYGGLSYRPKYFKAKPRQDKKKWRPGTVALREIREYQRRSHLVVQKRPILRYV